MHPPRLGKAALERGLANERRVLEACGLEKRPEWMLRARRASQLLEEDSGASQGCVAPPLILDFEALNAIARASQRPEPPEDLLRLASGFRQVRVFAV